MRLDTACEAYANAGTDHGVWLGPSRKVPHFINGKDSMKSVEQFLPLQGIDATLPSNSGMSQRNKRIINVYRPIYVYVYIKVK